MAASRNYFSAGGTEKKGNSKKWKDYPLSQNTKHIKSFKQQHLPIYSRGNVTYWPAQDSKTEKAIGFSAMECWKIIILEPEVLANNKIMYWYPKLLLQWREKWSPQSKSAAGNDHSIASVKMLLTL